MNTKAQNQTIRSISAFDLDHTLLSVNSGYCFGRFLCRKKRLPFSSLLFIIGCCLRHSIGVLSIVQLHESAFKRLFLGRSLPLIKQWAEEFIHEHLDKFLHLDAIEVLNKAQESGHLTAILSSSPDFIVEPIAKRLNVSFWEATRYAVDSNQIFCGIHKILLGEDKAICLNKLASENDIEKNETSAYSDSHLDLPFLLAAGKAYGVNPNRQLRKICLKNNWEII